MSRFDPPEPCLCGADDCKRCRPDSWREADRDEDDDVVRDDDGLFEFLPETKMPNRSEPLVRCLAHGCNKPDRCARHVAIRSSGRPPVDLPASNNACADGHAYIPVEEKQHDAA